MNLYQVIINVGAPIGSEGFDVDADGYRFERPQVEGVLPFIVFYRDLRLVLDPLAPAHAPSPDHPDSWCICGWEVDGFTAPELAGDKLADHIMDGNAPSAPALQANGEELEVFRAPLHSLLAVRLVDEEEEDGPNGEEDS